MSIVTSATGAPIPFINVLKSTGIKHIGLKDVFNFSNN